MQDFFQKQYEIWIYSIHIDSCIQILNMSLKQAKHTYVYKPKLWTKTGLVQRRRKKSAQPETSELCI